MFWCFGVSVDPDVLRRFVKVLVASITDVYETEDQACRDMLIKPTQWAAQKRGEGHISLTRLLLLDPEVRRCLAVRIAKEEGFPSFVHAAINLAAAAERPILKMEAPRSKERRTA